MKRLKKSSLRRRQTVAGRGSTQRVLALSLGVLAVGCGWGGAEEKPQAPSESASASAPEVPPRVDSLRHAFDSPYVLAEAILEALRAGDYDELMRYRIDEAEWFHLVWPELPSSRPGRGVPWEYAWRDLNQKSRNSLRKVIDRHEGQGYRLMRVEFADETTDYGSYKVHRDARVVVESADGRIVRLDLFGSVIERNGRFKAFSYVVD